MGEMHTVEQGEYLSSIALDYGFSDWQTIYNHPQNAEFKKKRPNPNILLPGDQLFIPDKQEKKESCPTDQKHQFQLKAPKALLKITLKDAMGKPIKNQSYRLKLEGGPTKKGTTDGSGLVQQEIPIGLEDGELILEKLGIHWPLKIGHLDPIHEEDEDKAIITGLQARLNNLGYGCGDVDGELDADTVAAIQQFQILVMGRDPDNATGELDQETRSALGKEHMC